MATSNDFISSVFHKQPLLFKARFLKKQLSEIFTGFLVEFVNALCIGDEVKLQNFGILHVYEGTSTRFRVEERNGVKVRIKTKMRIPKVAFRTAPALKNALYDAHGVTILGETVEPIKPKKAKKKNGKVRVSKKKR